MRQTQETGCWYPDWTLDEDGDLTLWLDPEPRPVRSVLAGPDVVDPPDVRWLGVVLGLVAVVVSGTVVGGLLRLGEWLVGW